MDPDANLAEQRRIAEQILTLRGAARLEALDRLGELCKALDEWIASGGFLPKAWQK